MRLSTRPTTISDSRSAYSADGTGPEQDSTIPPALVRAPGQFFYRQMALRLVDEAASAPTTQPQATIVRPPPKLMFAHGE